MDNCALAEKCIFFNDLMHNMPSTAAVYKKIYCQQDFAKCARYLVCQGKGRDKVPADLFPNQLERAEQILNS